MVACTNCTFLLYLILNIMSIFIKFICSKVRFYIIFCLIIIIKIKLRGITMNGGLKKRVLEKYNHKCFLCNKKAGGNTKLQIHHIIKREYGGLDIIINLVPLCPSCHLKTHTRNKKMQMLINSLQQQLNTLICKWKFYSIEEVAALLDTDKKVIKKAITTQNLKHEYIDKQVKVKGTAIIEWVLCIQSPTRIKQTINY